MVKEHKSHKEVGHWPYLAIVAIVAGVAVVFFVMKLGFTETDSELEINLDDSSNEEQVELIYTENNAVTGQASRMPIIAKLSRGSIAIASNKPGCGCSIKCVNGKAQCTCWGGCECGSSQGCVQI